jgi:hypothetical protein
MYTVTSLLLSHDQDKYSRCFQKIVSIFSSHPFYTQYVRQPSAHDPVPSQIKSNPDFYPFFKDAIGAMGGHHFPIKPPATERKFYRWKNYDGYWHSCIFATSFDGLFLFSFAGLHGSETDANVFEFAHEDGLIIPEGKYYLAHAGYPLCNELLTPYRGVRYHLSEWADGSV